MSNQNHQIKMAHGSGGLLSQKLFREVFGQYFDNPWLNKEHDGAILSIENTKLAFSTDTFVVNPLEFSGGNIGDLAVNGTVNDLAMCGAKPLYLSTGFIIEEGFEIRLLKDITKSMAQAAKKADVSLVTGDTKVVEKGKADGLFINTSGIGRVYPGLSISPKNASKGDMILINGNIAEHGMAILTKRKGISFETDISSDSAPLNGLIEEIIKAAIPLKVLRDPTRGGLASTLNEIAQAAKVEIILEENAIPITEPVKTACALLGLDPLLVANEGKFLAFVEEAYSEKLLHIMKNHPLGLNSSIIGQVGEKNNSKVIIKTSLGTTRIVDMPTGGLLPRIC